MNKKRVIAVFSGNRAEYGLQFPILQAIKNHPLLEYRLIVSGAHLDNNFGSTISEIRKDGFDIYAEVNIEMSGDKRTSTALAIASGISNLTPVLDQLKPDIFVVYADRFEGFAAVITSTQMNMPTAHIEGGDITEGGALDDSVRHAMSKLAHLHYTTNLQAANRILAMGEDPWRVNNVGFPAIDLIKYGSFETPENLIKRLQLNPKRPLVLFTQHSVTTEFEDGTWQLEPSLEALAKLADEGVQIIMTYPNNDAGGEKISKGLKKLSELKNPNIQLYTSLGRFVYHGILALAKTQDWRVACVGNSSSGIKETPVFGCPTVNIGSRQQGRLRGDNVIDADYNKEEIYSAIMKCLDDENFRSVCATTVNPYGGGSSGKLIAESLATVDLNPKHILRKGMNLKGIHENGWFR
ncbi:MAG: UDP-N-acetylglucosamine 2-epimerase (hydrolyzing) [Bacteroidetes bacterium]|nr:UDP-N-acetylglucosamine 2-epimerase (hydrolyzing) [Bacteroidota bacterium]